MENEKLFTMPFAKVYPLLVAKAERKNRTKQEVDQIIAWLTGYDEAGLEQQLKNQVDCRTFFDEAQRCLDQRFHLRLPGRRDPRSSVAEDPVFGQTGGRIGQGKSHGKDLTETMNPRIRQKEGPPGITGGPSSFFCAFIGWPRELLA